MKTLLFILAAAFAALCPTLIAFGVYLLTKAGCTILQADAATTAVVLGVLSLGASLFAREVAND